MERKAGGVAKCERAGRHVTGSNHTIAACPTGKAAVMLQVTAVVDIAAYAEEYSEAVDSSGVAARKYASSMIQDMLDSDSMPNHKHWLTCTVKEVRSTAVAVTEVAPAPTPGQHKDAMAPGERPPYSDAIGKFVARCTCGRMFTGDDEDDADAALFAHTADMVECKHTWVREGAAREQFYCDGCGKPMVWVGPNSGDFAPADA